MKDENTTRVIFRRWLKKDGGDVIALLLDVPANKGRVMMYEHVGQHGEGSYFGVMGSTRPAKDDEYSNLKRELESIGYRLILRKRRTLQAWRS